MYDVARKVRPWRDFEPIDERQRRGFIQPGAKRQEILHELKRALRRDSSADPRGCAKETSIPRGSIRRQPDH